MIFAHRREARSKNCLAEISPFYCQRVQIALGRTANRGFRIRVDDKPGPRAKQLAKFKGLECGNDSTDTGGAQRQVVRIAVHETHPAPVHAHLRQIPGKKHPCAVCAFFPMQNLESGKVTTDPNQSELATERVCLALPKPDTWIRALDPLPVVFVKVNRDVSEGLAPLDHG